MWVPGALCLPKHPLESRTEALAFSFFLVDFPQSHLRVLAWAKGSSIPLICSTGFRTWKKNKFYKMEDGFVFFKSLNLCVLVFVTHRALLRARFRLGFPLAWVSSWYRSRIEFKFLGDHVDLKNPIGKSYKR